MKIGKCNQVLQGSLNPRIRLKLEQRRRRGNGGNARLLVFETRCTGAVQSAASPPVR